MIRWCLIICLEENLAATSFAREELGQGGRADLASGGGEDTHQCTFLV